VVSVLGFGGALIVRYKRCCCLAISVGKGLREGWGRGVQFGCVEARWCGGGEAGEAGYVLGIGGRGVFF
jgi:hypothetical protein